MKGSFASLASLLVPGLGQLVQRRVGDAALFSFAALWLHMLAAGAVMSTRGAAEAVDAFVFGAFSSLRGLGIPVAVGLTVLGLTLHVWAAVDARRGQRQRARWLAPPRPE